MSPSAKGRDFLVAMIEDDPHDVELIKAALREVAGDPTVMVFRSATEAMDHLVGPRGASQRLPDLVLVDLKLPGMRGLDLLRTLRSQPRTQRLPLIVFTSSQEPSDIRDAYSAGATSYAVKPVSFDELRTVVRSIADYWLHVNEARPSAAQGEGVA